MRIFRQFIVAAVFAGLAGLGAYWALTGEREIERAIAYQYVLETVDEAVAYLPALSHSHRIQVLDFAEEEDLFADTSWINIPEEEGGGHFLFRFSIWSDVWLLQESVAHEWAHAMAWYSDDVTAHGPKWATHFGVCYRALFE